MPLFLGGAPRLTGRMHLIRQRLGRRGIPQRGRDLCRRQLIPLCRGRSTLFPDAWSAGRPGAAGGGAAAAGERRTRKGSPGRARAVSCRQSADQQKGSAGG